MVPAQDRRIGSERVRGDRLLDVVNPATEDVIARVPDCTREELDRAVAGARAAFPAWAARDIDDRRALLNALGDAILTNIDELKRLLTSEQGKPQAEAESEVIGAGYG